MSKKVIAAIVFLAMALLTLSCGALAEETEELQTDDEMQAEETEELQPEKPVRYMFVQNAQSGTFVSVDGEDNLYTLTLVGVSPQTIAFSDRPERVVAQVPMQLFLDGLDFGPENPPNAALEILEADEEEDVAVLELFDPVYDAASQTLQYKASILEQPDLSYAIFNELHDKALPENFGPAALFIDDCPDRTITCQKGDSWTSSCGNIKTGCCFGWNGILPGCWGCHSDDYYEEKCIKKYGTECYKFDCNCPGTG